MCERNPREGTFSHPFEVLDFSLIPRVVIDDATSTWVKVCSGGSLGSRLLTSCHFSLEETKAQPGAVQGLISSGCLCGSDPRRHSRPCLLMMEEEDEDEAWLQLRPTEPLPTQCCGGGCNPCIFDIYHQQLSQWKEAWLKKDKSLLWRKKEESQPLELSTETFQAFSISAVEWLTKDTCQVRFALPENRQLGLSLGQHLILRGTVDGLDIQRAYTPISHRKAQGYFEVLIKKMGGPPGWRSEEGAGRSIFLSSDLTSAACSCVSLGQSWNPAGLFPHLPHELEQPTATPLMCLPREPQCYEKGLMSQYVKAWKVGDVAFWRGPFGGFPYRPNQYGELLMLAAGTGLAPMLPILRDITDDEKDETFVTLVGCFKTFEDIYLKPLLQDLARYWNVRTFFVLSQEDSLDKLPASYRERTRLGRLGPAWVRELVASSRRKPFALVCGPAHFSQDMALGLQGAGLAQDSLFLF
ncbi:NADH-cytochrome b5 reductase-like [Monodelphis domestica]|uniref:NADH-cytochrome b5 reductase-like n=1 Tax=Monodelphis domestica TaxID=13616 RepID=UPI0024E1A5C5|nr:NADH-cytochrome b5 reductase-like [Monodelphis domestica]